MEEAPKPKTSFLEKLMSRKKDSAVPETAPGGEGANVYAQLFHVVKPGNQQSVPGTPTTPSVLGPRPIGEDAAAKRVLRENSVGLVRSLFMGCVLLFALAGLFFKSQLSPTFTILSGTLGPNLAQQLDTSVSNVIQNKTEVNLLQLSVAQISLDRINQLADGWELYGNRIASHQTSEASKANARAARSQIKEEVLRLLEQIQNIFEQSLFVPLLVAGSDVMTDPETRFEQALMENLNARRQTLQSDPEANADALRKTTNIIRLTENRVFRAQIAGLSLENMDDATLTNLFDDIRKNGTDDLSLIARIRKERIFWTQIISELNRLSLAVDELYGQGYYDEAGGIRYTGYTFNSKDRRISINGETKTQDTKTFTLIADLVDTFEASPLFSDLQVRTFTKGQSEDGWTGSIQLSFSLEEESEEDGSEAVPAEIPKTPETVTPETVIPNAEPAL